MSIGKFAIMSAMVTCLVSCGNSQKETGTQSSSEQTPVEAQAAAASAPEPGSGVYGFDCDAATGRYEILLRKGGDGFVTAQVTADAGRFDNLLTSYSFMGDSTPPDFLIAILFDAANAPVPDSDAPRIEIWKGENSYFARVNGKADEKLEFCAEAKSGPN